MSAPTEVDFGRQVRDVLLRFHDLTYLETHPLTRLVDAPQDGRPLRQGKVLRDSLLAAIDDLKPAPDLPPMSHAWRGHQILTLRYVEALDAAVVRARLAISQSEFQRDHRAALDAMTSLLRNRWRPTPAEMTKANGQAPGGGGGRDSVLPSRSPRPLVPTSLSSFVGRNQELADVARLLSETRLVTLIGPPGCGKTRLALEVAAAHHAAFRDGVVFVPLAMVRDPTLVLPAIGRTLDFQERDGSDLANDLTSWLRDKHLLLILDNLEQVVAAGPRVVEILGPGRNVRVLITSRTPLRVRGEQVYPLSPLATPDPTGELPVAVVATSPAVQLFVDRVRAVRPDFALTAANAPVVAETVRRLDGLPLAIELAAARNRLLTPDALLRRLRRCLPFLSGGPRDLPTRQQTLRDAIAWSYDLLEEPRRALFRRLAVFVGTFSPDAAEAVCADPIAEESVDPQPAAFVTSARPCVAASDVFDGLQELLDHGLVRTYDAPDGEPRFDLLETLREYAADQLAAHGESARLAERHARFYLQLARETAAAYASPECDSWEGRLERDLDNLIAALRWAAAQGDVETALRAVGDLCFFWMGHAPVELRRWLVDLLRATAAMGPSAGRGRGLVTLGVLALNQNDLRSVRVALEEAVRESAAAGDTIEEVSALRGLSRVATEEGDWVRGVELAEEALTIAQEAENPLAVKQANIQLGQAAFCVGDLSRARELLQSGFGATPDDSSAREVATYLNWLGHVATARGDFAEAWDRYAEALEWRRRGEYRVGFAYALTGFAHLTAARGQHERAARLSGSAAAICLEGGLAANRSQEPGVRERLAASRLAISPEAFEAAWAEGRRMTVEEACAYALAGRNDGMS